MAHRVCPNCSQLVPTGKRCPCQRRGLVKRNRAVYGSKRWQRLRAVVLNRDGHLCQEPMPSGGVCGKPATVAAHVTPFTDEHDPRAWSPANVRASCKLHNDREAGKRSHTIPTSPTPAHAPSPNESTIYVA